MNATLKFGSRKTSEEIENYLQTGEHDLYYMAWPGSGIIDRAKLAEQTLLSALVSEVRFRSGEQAAPASFASLDIVGFTRRKTEPMIRGLFPKVEQEVLLRLVEKSVVFLAPDNIEAVLRGRDYLSTAWKVANIYLDSIGAEPLGGDLSRIVGLSEHTTCFVSLAYFGNEHPFADFVIHEVAHIFHNCKRRTVGLPETRKREWLLNIDFGKRETFAYSCEAYSRIVERASRASERAEVAKKFNGFDVAEDRIDNEEIVGIVQEACTLRNGWKAILARCAPEPKLKI